MSGLEIAAGAAQVISLAFEVFHGCIEGYKLCHAAQLIGRDGDLLRTKLQIERCRLEEWAECARLDTENPDGRLNWPLVYAILEQQHTILTSAEKLRAKYSLDLPVLSPDEVEKEQKVDGNGNGKERDGLDRILRALKPKLYTASSRAIAAANGPVMRFQWAVAGREQVIKVIDDLGDLNTQLERLLEAPDRSWLKSGMRALLQDALSRTTNVADVETLEAVLRPAAGVGDAAIHAATEFKRIRLVLGVDQRPDETQPPQTTAMRSSMPHLRMLKETRLKSSHASSVRQCGLHSATYQNELVLVEWRETSAIKYGVLLRHMQSLALLLGSVDNTFATLPCKGLMASKESCRFALVYAMPTTMLGDTEKASDIEPRALYDLLVSQRHVSLRQRVSIACTIAEAVLQLHSAGWLHKSIRTDNIIFVSSAEGDAASFLDTRPYLTGYDYARPESEATLTALPNAPMGTDLYRHPDKRGPIATGYNKRFDLFAMGCVLVELALWERLVGILSRHTDTDWGRSIDEAERQNLDLPLPSLLDIVDSSAFTGEMHHAAGPQYLEAVRLCLLGRSDVSGDGDFSLEVQRAVAAKLSQTVV